MRRGHALGRRAAVRPHLPGWIGMTVRAWAPVRGSRILMARRRFWPVVAVLALAGLPVNLACMFCMSMAGEWVLAAWTLAVGGLLAVAAMRRARDAGLSRILMAALLAPLAVSASLCLLVPLVCLDGNPSDTAAAAVTSLSSYLYLGLPLVFGGCLPSRRSRGVRL